MRRVTSILLLLMVPVMLISADRDPGTYSIGFYGGVVMPQGPKAFQDYFNNGIGLGGEFIYNINPKTSLGLSYSYYGFKADADKFKEVAVGMVPESFEGTITMEIDPYTVSVISANLIKYFTQPEASTGFYITLGGGYYMMKFPDVTGTGNGESYTEKGESENKFGINGGLGVEIKAGRNINLFVEGKYHYVFTKDESNSDDTVQATAVSDDDASGKLKFISIMGGIRYALGQ